MGHSVRSQEDQVRSNQDFISTTRENQLKVTNRNKQSQRPRESFCGIQTIHSSPGSPPAAQSLALTGQCPCFNHCNECSNSIPPLAHQCRRQKTESKVTNPFICQHFQKLAKKMEVSGCCGTWSLTGKTEDMHTLQTFKIQIKHRTCILADSHTREPALKKMLAE